MNKDAITEQLEELARRLGIEIRYEPIILDQETINVVGGLIKGRKNPRNDLLKNSHVRMLNLFLQDPPSHNFSLHLCPWPAKIHSRCLDNIPLVRNFDRRRKKSNRTEGF